MANEKITAEYLAELEKVFDNVDKVKKQIIYSTPETVAVNYGHIGSLQHVNKLLNELLEFLTPAEGGR